MLSHFDDAALEHCGISTATYSSLRLSVAQATTGMGDIAVALAVVTMLSRTYHHAAAGRSSSLSLGGAFQHLFGNRKRLLVCRFPLLTIWNIFHIVSALWCRRPFLGS